MTRATAEWRNDPERVRAAEDLYNRWVQARNRAGELMAEAQRVLSDADLNWDDSTARMLRDAQSKLRDARFSLARVDNKDATPTYLGNMAAFGVGTDRDYYKNNPSKHDCIDDWWP